MDTKKESAAADVPTFKIARVGNDKKRKKGALSFLRGGGGNGARGVWGATSGSGAAAVVGGSAMTVSQIVTVVAMLGLMASASIFLANRDMKKPVAEKKKEAVFAKEKVKIEGDTTNLPGKDNMIPNSMGYISGSRDGLTDEERAKKAAEAAAAAEAQRLADEEAAKKAAEAEKNQTAAAPAVDPNALLAGAQGDGKGGGGGGGGLGKKFGSLSSSLGGGLAGGAGMSGGMNRSFGGGGNFGKGAGGKLSGASAQAGRAKSTSAGARSTPRSSSKGFARRQLAVAANLGRRATGAGKAETATSDAGTAFDNNATGGTTIEGAGLGAGGPKTGQGDGLGSGGPQTGNLGGPTTPTGPACGAEDSKMLDPNTGQCVPIPEPKADSAQKIIDTLSTIAMVCLGIIAAIAVIKGICDGSVLYAELGAVLGGIMAALGAIIMAMGIAIMAMGNYLQGAVLTAVGGTVCAVACIPYFSDYLTSGTMLIASAAGLLLAPLAGMLDGSMKNKGPAAAQQ